MKWIVFFVMILSGFWASAQWPYVWPSDSATMRGLKRWQDQKFGLMMHWGTYAQWGIVESWSLCPEDEGWTVRRGPYATDYQTYKSQYEAIPKIFNPTRFNPESWAVAAKYAGMKYVVFTTKHHDGFCMFDTKQTDYKITNPDYPFASSERSNIAREIFSSFRKKGFLIGAYFSKPDWHQKDYWWSYFPPKDRNSNYNPAKYPERWESFRNFTFNQLKELTGGDYGKIDILWLDGGWVRPYSSIDTSVSWQKTIPYEQDIRLGEMLPELKKNNPEMLVVDRSVGGPLENYTTPEQEVPHVPLNHPWETCMTMATSWSYVPNDHYKSTTQIIHLLAKIVSRGGNLLLNIGPDPQGNLPDTALARLKEIGDWMQINGESIYGTKPIAPYEIKDVVFTQKNNDVYAIVLQPSALKNLEVPFWVKSAQILGSKSVVGLAVEDAGTTSLQFNDELFKKNFHHALVIKMKIK
jgi:alpha-L-fucosidase